MLRCCENEDELAAVLAHEICHVEKKHGLSAIKQGRLTEAFTVVAAESAKQLGGEDLASLTREFEGSVGDVVKTLTTSGYSRTQETSADAAAVQLLRRAGYPETAMITMLQRMDERLTDAGGLGFAKTHPSARAAVDALRTADQGSEVRPRCRQAATFCCGHAAGCGRQVSPSGGRTAWPQRVSEPRRCQVGAWRGDRPGRRDRGIARVAPGLARILGGPDLDVACEVLLATRDPLADRSN